MGKQVAGKEGLFPGRVNSTSKVRSWNKDTDAPWSRLGL